MTSEQVLRDAMRSLIFEQVLVKKNILGALGTSVGEEEISRARLDSSYLERIRAQLLEEAELVIMSKIRSWNLTRVAWSIAGVVPPCLFTYSWVLGKGIWDVKRHILKLGGVKPEDQFGLSTYGELLNVALGPTFVAQSLALAYVLGLQAWRVSAIVSEGLKIPSLDILCQYARFRPFIDESPRGRIDSLFVKYWDSPSDESLSVLKRVVDMTDHLPITRWSQRPNSSYLESLTRLAPKTYESLLGIYKRFAKQGKLSSARRFPYYLTGAPGTGKTYAVKMLAKALDLPVIKLSLEGASVSDIVGRDVDDPDATAGRLVEAIVQKAKESSNKQSFSNSIIFIDEFDKLLRSTSQGSEETLALLLKLLDPDNLSVTNKFLGAEISFKDNIIILAGNYDLRERALTNRFRTIEFSGFTKEGKVAMVREEILPGLLKVYGISEQDFDVKSFYGDVDRFIYEKDNDPGLRSLMKHCEMLLERIFELQED